MPYFADRNNFVNIIAILRFVKMGQYIRSNGALLSDAVLRQNVLYVQPSLHEHGTLKLPSLLKVQ